MFNLATELVDRHVAEGRGSRPALRLADRTVTYAQLLELVNRAGNELRAAGVEPEQRVAILLPDSPEFVAAFIGAMKIGAVPVPLNTFARPVELLALLEHSRARALVAHPSLLTPELADATRCVKVEDSAFAAGSSELDAYPTQPDEPCYWLYSSGTTGQPKAVVHLHGDMPQCVQPYAQQVLGITPEDVTFSVPRLFFSYGLVNSLFLPLLNGASAILCAARPDIALTLETVRELRPTLFFSVPTSYAQLVATAGDAFRSVRLAISAGEPLPAPVYDRWTHATGIELLDGLGSTEAGYIFCSNLPGSVRPGSSGVMLGEHRGRIVDEHGHDMPDGESGELWVACKSTALQYWNDRTRTKRTFWGEWLRTGDRYRRDADGFLWYEGRVDDVFKVNGQWVSPLEVESCLLEHPAVLECAVVAASDADGLQKPKAFVVTREPVTASDLQQRVRDRLQPYKYPRWIEFVPELPKTITGKVQRYRLK